MEKKQTDTNSHLKVKWKTLLNLLEDLLRVFELYVFVNTCHDKIYGWPKGW